MIMPAWLRILLYAVLTALLVWWMGRTFPQYVVVTGGTFGIIAVAALLTLMNLAVRPILSAITLPLRLFATLLASIIVNVAFLWIVLKITDVMDPEMAGLQVKGIVGWVVISTLLGLENGVLHMILRKRKTD